MPSAGLCLKKYLSSLDKIKEMDVEIPLPGHRGTGDWTLFWKAEFLINHHDKRLKEVLNILDREPGLDAYGLAGRIKFENAYYRRDIGARALRAKEG